MSGAFTESVVEDAAIAWLEALGYAVLHGSGIAASDPGVERGDTKHRDAAAFLPTSVGLRARAHA